MLLRTPDASHLLKPSPTSQETTGSTPPRPPSMRCRSRHHVRPGHENDHGDSRPDVVDAVLPLAFTADVTVTAGAHSAGSTRRWILAQPDRARQRRVGRRRDSEQLENPASCKPRARYCGVPGMVISHHSGEGKPNQYYLRASTWTTGPTLPSASPAYRSTCRRTRTDRDGRTSTPDPGARERNPVQEGPYYARKAISRQPVPRTSTM